MQNDVRAPGPVRWAAVEAVQKPCEPVVQKVKTDILAHRGREARYIAKVAAGRKILEVVFYILHDGQGPLPDRRAADLCRARDTATGEGVDLALLSAAHISVAPMGVRSCRASAGFGLVVSAESLDPARQTHETDP
ncbi:MAG: hypothetical protein JWM02_1331 [Frankiales bacterium]|nr:hypothetical protein [Frankiales bacterium]